MPIFIFVFQNKLRHLKTIHNNYVINVIEKSTLRRVFLHNVISDVIIAVERQYDVFVVYINVLLPWYDGGKTHEYKLLNLFETSE